MKLNTEEAMKKISDLIEEVKKVDGTFISLWHNDTFSDYKQWLGWKDVYKNMIKLASS